MEKESGKQAKEGQEKAQSDESSSTGARPKRRAAEQAAKKITGLVSSHHGESRGKARVKASKDEASSDDEFFKSGDVVEEALESDSETDEEYYECRTAEPKSVKKGSSRPKKRKPRLNPTEVKIILEAAQDPENQVPPFDVLYKQIVKYNPQMSKETPWIMTYGAGFKPGNTVGEELYNKKKLQLYIYWMSHTCEFKRELEQICCENNVGTIVNDLDVSDGVADMALFEQEEVQEEEPICFLEYDKGLELPVCDMILQGSDRGYCQTGQKPKRELRDRPDKKAKVPEEAASSSSQGPAPSKALHPPLESELKLKQEHKKRLAAPAPKELPAEGKLMFAADGNLAELEDPGHPEKLILMNTRYDAIMQKIRVGQMNNIFGAQHGSLGVQQIGQDKPNAKVNVVMPKKQQESKGKKHDAVTEKIMPSKFRKWIQDNDFVSSFPNSVKNVVDTDKISVKILKVYYLNFILHIILELLGYTSHRKQNVEFILAATEISQRVLRDFCKHSISMKNTNFITILQAAQWAKMARLIIENVYPLQGWPTMADSFCFEKETNITPALVLRILRVQTAWRHYLYEEGNVEGCPHVNGLTVGDIGVPYFLFAEAARTGRIPPMKVKHTCRCGSRISMKLRLMDSGFFVIMPGYGEALNNANINEKLPQEVTIEGIRYLLRSLGAVTNIGHATVIVPGQDERVRSNMDDGTYVAGKADTKCFPVSGFLATYVRAP